jgi:hypothetical protein
MHHWDCSTSEIDAEAGVRDDRFEEVVRINERDWAPFSGPAVMRVLVG